MTVHSGLSVDCRFSATITMAYIHFLALALCASLASAAHFCYDEADCGPVSVDWAGSCQTGTRQSPIDLPLLDLNLGTTPLRLFHYSGTHFRMTNTGHSIQVDFQNSGPTTQPFPFPDPLATANPFNKTVRNYNLGSVHFHWGPTDRTGSEHCVGPICYAMEMHFVHYWNQYPSQADAVASGDPNALSVLGVFLNAYSIGVTNLLGLFTGSAPLNLTPSSSPLSPIVNHLNLVANPGSIADVMEPLDFTPLISEALLQGPQVYSYKGSLTTPGCNEQVNWFVLKHPAKIPSNNVAAFRNTVRDSRSLALHDNHRPLQPLNGRTVMLNTILYPY